MVLHLTNADISRSITPSDARGAVLEAFRAWGEGDAAVQQRVRTECDNAKLSTLGAVLPGGDGDGVIGAKVYATVDGQFTFLVALFSSSDGRLLATMEADALTRLRTAATSVVAAEALGPSDPRHLTVFGSGVQGQGHVEAFAARFALETVVLVGRTPPIDVAARLSEQLGREVGATDDAGSAAAAADLVVTATRAVEPVLHGATLRPGAHVSAIGSSRPQSRELDEAVYGRAAVVAVEWREQAREEAGGLIQAVAGGVVSWEDVVDLADVLTGRTHGRRADDAVTVFQAVGVGLEDVAVAALAVRATST